MQMIEAHFVIGYHLLQITSEDFFTSMHNRINFIVLNQQQ